MKRPEKWIESVNECVKNMVGLGRMARVCEEGCLGLNPGDEPLNLTISLSFWFPQFYEAPRGGYFTVVKPKT